MNPVDRTCHEAVAGLKEGTANFLTLDGFFN